MPTRLIHNVSFLDDDGGLIRTFSDLRELGDWLDKISVPFHETTDHTFMSRSAAPGFCEHCDWIHPNYKARTDCGHSLAEHAQMAKEIVNKATGLANLEPEGEVLQFNLQGVFYLVADLLGLQTDQPDELKIMMEQADQNSMEEMERVLLAALFILARSLGRHGPPSVN